MNQRPIHIHPIYQTLVCGHSEWDDYVADDLKAVTCPHCLENIKTALSGTSKINSSAPDALHEGQTKHDAGVTMGLPAATSERGRNCVESKKDPNGLDAHDPGAKLDAEKVRLGLVLHGFCRALMAVGKVGTYGAAKYSDNGWMQVDDGQRRYTDAMYRHLMSEASGEDCDYESNLLHAAHTAWNALARLELMLKHGAYDEAYPCE